LSAVQNSRLSFAKIPKVLDIPDLLIVQKDSFKWFIEEGLKEILDEISPIEDFSGRFSLEFLNHFFEEPLKSLDECKITDSTYSQPLYVTAQFLDRETGQIKQQTVFLGDFPIMSDTGTFIINGTERVIVSQLVRSPGVYFSQEIDKTSDKEIFIGKMIPGRGAWLEFDTDKRDTVGVRVDRKRRQHITAFLRALGVIETKEEAIFVSDEIEKIISKKRSLNEIAILFRIAAHTRSFEDRFIYLLRNSHRSHKLLLH